MAEPDRRVRIVAHRTLPLHAPENSLAGIAAAAAAGVDAVEVDARLTRDGTAVLHHDGSPWREARWPVPIRFLSAQRWEHLTHRRSGGAAPLPRLQDALETIAAHPGLGVRVDVKDRRALQASGRAVRDAGLAERSGLWVRAEADVAVARRLVPGAEVALLRDTRGPADTEHYLAEAAQVGAGAVSVHVRAISPAVTEQAHALGLRLYCWVVAPELHQRALDAGVDAIVTDWPELVRPSAVAGDLGATHTADVDE